MTQERDWLVYVQLPDLRGRFWTVRMQEDRANQLGSWLQNLGRMRYLHYHLVVPIENHSISVHTLDRHLQEMDFPRVPGPRKDWSP